MGTGEHPEPRGGSAPPPCPRSRHAVRTGSYTVTVTDQASDRVAAWARASPPDAHRRAVGAHRRVTCVPQRRPAGRADRAAGERPIDLR